MDVGESGDIHPKDKKPVGERLAAIALSQVYGKAGQALAALPGTPSRKGAEVSLSYSPAPRLGPENA